MLYINSKVLVEKLKSSTPTFGLKRGMSKDLVIVFDKFKAKIPEAMLYKVRFIDLETLNKVKSFLNKPFTINVIGL